MTTRASTEPAFVSRSFWPRSSSAGDLLRESARDPPEVDDAGPWRVECPDPLDGRLDLPEIILAEKRCPVDAVRLGPRVKIVQAGQIALVRRDHDLAATLRRDSVLLAVCVQRSASLHAQPRFERARGVVDPRVDNAAVMPVWCAAIRSSFSRTRTRRPS